MNKLKQQLGKTALAAALVRNASRSRHIYGGWHVLLLNLMLLNLIFSAAIAGTVDYPRVSNPADDPTTQGAAKSQFETAIVKHGATVLVAYVDTSAASLGNQKHGISISRSTDHGKKFNKITSASGNSSLPNTTDGDKADPVLLVNKSTGHFFLLCNRFPEGPGFQVFRSTDDGATFILHGSAVHQSNAEMDKPHAAIDNYSGTGNGNLYAAGVQIASGESAPTRGIWFSRSTNGGSTWGTPLLLANARDPNAPANIVTEVFAPWVVVGPDHSVYVFWLDTSLGSVDDNPNARYYIRMRKSTNQGVSFGSAVNVVDLTASSSYFGEKGDMGLYKLVDGAAKYFLTEAFPQAVANPKNQNQLFVTFAAKGLFPNDKADAFIAMSNDGGSTWTTSPSLWTQNPTGWKPAARVNHDAANADQWRPSLAVKPDGKRLFVGYYDRRDNVSPGEPPYGGQLLYTEAHVYGTIYSISGTTLTWVADAKLTDTPFVPLFNYQGNPDNEPDLKNGYWGSYDGVTADHDFFYYSYSHHADPIYPSSGPNVRLAKFFAPEPYQIVDLGTFGGYYSDGNGINNLGQVTGFAQGTTINWTGGYNQKGFLYSGGVLIDMQNPGGSSYDEYINYYGNAVNDTGVVAGWLNYYDYYRDPYRWTQTGGYSYLGHLDINYETYALGINNAGAVAGYGVNSSGLLRGTYWAAGSTTVVDLEGFEGFTVGESVAYGVNSQNRVVGKSRITVNGTPVWHGFNLLNPTAANPIRQQHDLGTLSGQDADFSEARAINATGFVVGGSGPNTWTYTPFIKAPGTAKHQGFTSLGQMPGGSHALALSVNSQNRVVGYGNSTWGSVAFLYPEAGNNLIPLEWVLSPADQSSWDLITAEGLNDNRQVTGWGYHNGAARAYLLSPIP
jgi:hypothetical protein